MKKTGVKTWEAETILKDIQISYQVRENEQSMIMSISASVLRVKTKDFLGHFDVTEDGSISITFTSFVTDSEKKALFDAFFKDLDDIKRKK